MRENISPTHIETLVKQAQKGDQIALGDLFDHFYEPITRYVSFKVSDDNVGDLVGEIFLKVVQNIKKYRTQKKAHFSSWVFRIAHNAVVDFYRRQKEVLGLEFGSDDEETPFFYEIPDENLRPDEEVMATEEAEYIRALMAELPASQREIIELKFLNDFSNHEISTITGKSEGNIRIIQLRALKKLREIIH